jgi:hypothetical protein
MKKSWKNMIWKKFKKREKSVKMYQKDKKGEVTYVCTRKEPCEETNRTSEGKRANALMGRVMVRFL